ncbi:sensor histidine kinase KdpD [Oceanobacillus sp. J11TS1]|uniref:sensor histidine kinase n=1 Tax=Oceanobacillus sp. J11TS1 TaxID=2807191 RepID=UPI001B27ECA4|nr:HAMP domain-containing sensor histidine kinase [Oceanobacillus sp. J11TS1]GIO22116.1 two-component sensor histidine kinase [Oceanobacillus sp. J11TS1]
MKWKLTLRYLISILSIVFIVSIVNTIILIALMISQQDENPEDIIHDTGENFTRSFYQHLSIEDNRPVVSDTGKYALTQFGAWLQILDENGNVIASENAPDSASTHYTPIELVHKYKYMDNDFNTYFIGEFEDYSYIIGVPNSKQERTIIMADPKKVLTYVSKFLIAIIIVDLIIACIVGFLFSTVLTKPVSRLIERISELKERKFQPKKMKRPGVFKHVFANLNDVSETLQAHENERQKLERMRNEWISNVSHDIKTPLASIRGYAELLQSDELSAEERLEYAGVIERQSLYMKELLDDFNLTMRLRNQEMPLNLQDTRIEGFVRKIIIDLLNDPQFHTHEIDFISNAPASIWKIDQHLMKRALLNFIINAFIHNEEEVKVTVEVAEDRIIIHDDGRGIKQEDQAQIFDRYYRGTSTTNTRGSGLGMAISRDIIQAHGGSVELESETGKGTTIRITLKG